MMRLTLPRFTPRPSTNVFSLLISFAYDVAAGCGRTFIPRS